VLDEVRAGIGRVEEEQEDLDEATAAAAARLGVEPPASSPEESPRFPSPRDIEQRERDRDDGMLSATRPDTPAPVLDEPAPSVTDELPRQPALTDTDGAEAPGSEGSDAPPTLDTDPAITEQTLDADATQPVPTAVGEGSEGAADGEGVAHDQDATQRLTPVGNGGNGGNNKGRSNPKPVAREGKGRF
jgi:hypothetical protein